MADRAIRDFGALPSYPPSAPHSSNKIFSTTAARAWNASPSASGAASGPVSLTPSHSHHKARTSFPLAKFRPNLWEQGLGSAGSEEAKVERELASWQTGWATDRSAHSSSSRTSSGAYQSENPYTRSAAVAASASAGGRRADPRFQQTDDHSHNYSSPRGSSDAAYSGSSSAGSVAASTMTEPFGEYGSVLARVTELAAQVKHLHKLHGTLEANLQTKTRQLDELRSEHEQVKADPNSAGAKQAQLQDLSASHAALQSSAAETGASLAALTEKCAAQTQQLQAQDHALAAVILERDQLRQRAALDAVELGKMSQLREEVRLALGECARRDEERQRAEEALRQRELELTQTEEALQARLAAVATTQRLADEAAAARAAASSSDQPQPLSPALQAEQEKLLALQTQELERLRALAAKHEGDPAHRPIPDDHPELAAARSSVAQLQAHNASLGAELVHREKTIADLLASSVYRRNMLAANKERDMTPEERAKANKKKSAACSIM